MSDVKASTLRLIPVLNNFLPDGGEAGYSGNTGGGRKGGVKNSEDDLVGRISLKGVSLFYSICVVFATFAQVFLLTGCLCIFYEILHLFVILYLSMYCIYLSVHSIFVRASDWNVKFSPNLLLTVEQIQYI